MANKTTVHKLPGGKASAAKAVIPKPGSSKKDAGKDQKSESELVALARKNFDEHLRQRGYFKAEERKPRPVKELLQLFLSELKDGWWPENIWLWKQGINRAEMNLLKVEIFKRINYQLKNETSI